VEICSQLHDEILSKKFLAKIKFSKIDPWGVAGTLHEGTDEDPPSKPDEPEDSF
jgi:hypothetical protein